MSILRLTVDRDEIHAPEHDGTFVAGPYNTLRRVGHLGECPSGGGNYSVNPPAFLNPHLRSTLPSRISALPDTKPVVVMVHGFLFNPFEGFFPKRKDCDNPHFRVYHFEDVDAEVDNEHHITPWPKRLGLMDMDRGGGGLGVAFGWLSNPGFAKSMLTHFQNFYARAYDYASEAAWTLVHTLDQVEKVMRDLGKHRRIDLFCHSLGSRVVLHAIKLAARHNMEHVVRNLDRVVILGGAEYVRDAQETFHEVLRVCAAGEGPAFYNVTCRENDVLDKLAENFGPRGFGNHAVVGHDGLAFDDPGHRWMDLQLDSPDLAAWAKTRFGWTLMGDGPRIWDHWYYYTHEPNCRMYRAILHNRPAWGIRALKNAGIPHGTKI